MLEAYPLNFGATSKFCEWCPCRLRKLCLLNERTVNAANALSKIVKIHKFPRRKSLFIAGDDFNNIYTIKSGIVKTYMLDEDGTEQVIDFHLPGDVIGLDAIAKFKHPTSAITLKKSTICELPYQRFIELCDSAPELYFAIANQLSSSLQRTQHLLMIINHKTAEERLAFFLLDFSYRLHLIDLSPVDFQLKISRAEIGNYLGLASETISRIFTHFEKEGLIHVKGKNIHIKDINGLINRGSHYTP